MKQAGVLGRPIAHSLSPALHRAAYAALGLDWTYEAIDCGVAELPHVLAERDTWAGFSCTMPLKRAVLDIAVDVRPVAGAVGAGNTLLPGPDGWIADNTDVHGLVAALREHAVRPRSASVLGAGGTAQAALAALAELGLPECTVLVRDPRRTAALLATADRVGIAVSLADLEAGTEALEADVVISTLPPGAADQVAGHPWSARQAVLDVVYADWPTALARAAAATGAISISGATVLLHQAARQVELMTGQPAPLAAMHAALPGGDF